MRYILTDIEGTTTSVAFVYDILFPYFIRHVTDFLRDAGEQNEVIACRKAVQHTVWEEEGRVLPDHALAQQLTIWTKSDRKHPALKSMQGMVWRAGYQKGEIKGHLYPDVPPALARWQAAGLGLGVYSSGSVEAQRLLFGHSDFGDLTRCFSHYFDTQVGHKREPQSYRSIAESLVVPPAEILFLSDVVAELDAAVEAGMLTIQLVRPGTEPGLTHRMALDFTEITPR